ncbi:GTPase family protein [Limimaricola cinnabarinus]|uniref:GTPase family protein n=1 Tax=Limimaricola cinnabarinus TaxID=1125964 RepID=UPI002FE35C98
MMVKRLRSLLLRWRILVPVIAVSVPFLIGFGLGMLWLNERGVLIEYAVVCSLIGVLVYLGMKLPAWLSKNSDDVEFDADEGQHVEADPDWTEGERRAYAAAQRLINARLRHPMPPEQMQPFALEVITEVANASGDRGKLPLEFTIPEALLLIERISSRLRDDLRSYAPISDRISVKTMVWIWENQQRVRKLYGMGRGAYRVFRAFQNAPAAAVRELNDLVTSGNSQMLTGEVQAIFQRILFEEVAKAATELYSGRLRMSDAEILDSILLDTALDRKRLAAPDAPLRIAIAGQVSAGKSTLVNALLGRDAAETDMPPVTDRPTAHEGEIAGIPCHVIDLPGLDGDKKSCTATLSEAQNCDILVWALPANRPGREVDRSTIETIRTQFLELPNRRLPPILGAATFCDRLAGEAWPYPEHHIPADIQARIGNAMIAISSDVGIERPTPICLGEAQWNVGALRQRIAGSLVDGINVQRNRVRLTMKDKTIGREAVDTFDGLRRGLLSFGRHAAQRYLGDR